MQVRQCVLLAKWCLVQIFSIPLVAVGCSFLFPMAHGAAPPEPIFATSQVRHHGCHFSMCKHGHPWDCDLTAAVPCLWRDQRCHACDLLRLVVVKLVPQDVLKCNVLIHCSDGWDRTAQVSSARSPRSPSQPWLNRYPTGVWLKHGVLLKSRHFFWSKLPYFVFLCNNLLHLVAPYGIYDQNSAPCPYCQFLQGGNALYGSTLPHLARLAALDPEGRPVAARTFDDVYGYWLVVWNMCYFSIYWEYLSQLTN